MGKVHVLVPYRLEEHRTFRSSSERASETFRNDTEFGSPEIQRDRWPSQLSFQSSGQKLAAAMNYPLLEKACPWICVSTD